MQVDIRGYHLPGRVFECSHGGPYGNVHVAVQERRDPVGLVRGDAESPNWVVDVRVVDTDGGIDFHGPAVHGTRNQRFLYLTWGDVQGDGSFVMFRRAKLMLSDIDPALIEQAESAGQALVARVDLTDDLGGPRCARLHPPVIEWHVGRSRVARSRALGDRK